MSDPTLTDWTPAPWRAVECDLEGGTILDYLSTLLGNREADGTSTGRAFMVLGPNVVDPERGGEVVVAFTGDGPQAEANAHRIAARTAPETVALDVEEGPVTGQSLYEQHGWSGCEGSAWDNLPLATRSGWTYAAIQTYAQAETVAPDVEAVARVIFAAEQCDRKQCEDVEANWLGRLDDRDRSECRELASAVVAADQRRPVAEVKAEALRELRTRLHRAPVLKREELALSRWLCDEADRIERDAATSEGVEG